VFLARINPLIKFALALRALVALRYCRVCQYRYLRHAAPASPGAAERSKWQLEPAHQNAIKMPLLASKWQLEAALAPGIACKMQLLTSKWLLEPAPQPQNSIKIVPLAAPGRSSLPRSHRVLVMATRACVRACFGAMGLLCVAARACLPPTHGHGVRAYLALDMAARKVLSSVRLPSASTFPRLNFASWMAVHRLQKQMHKYIICGGILILPTTHSSQTLTSSPTFCLQR